MTTGWILYQKSEAEITAADYGVTRLKEAAKAKNVELKVFKPEQFELIVDRKDKQSIFINGKPEPLPDFILPRMGSGTTYYALAIIRHLEHLGVYTCNSSRSIEIAKDKLHIHQLLAQSNLPTPKTILAKFPIDPKIIKKELGYPVVVKNVVGTEGKGIYLSPNENSFVDLMDLIYTNNKHANIILQQYISSSKGSDLRIFVIGGKAVAAMKRTAKKGFKANFTLGGTVEHFELNQALEWVSTEVARLVGLDVTGIDLLFNESGGFMICEANSSPGFKGMEEVTGKVIAEQILDFILLNVMQRIP